MTHTAAPLTVNGWKIYAHGLFLDQLEALVESVEAARTKDPLGFSKKNETKRLAAILKLAFEKIPQDPTRTAYRQGDSLDDQNKHWYRAKFFQQYRLFFRYSSSHRTIILAWVNDEKTKRAYGAKTDAYKVFERMLASGNPPNDWDELMSNAKANHGRLKRLKSQQ
jgi:toxin YhaV